MKIKTKEDAIDLANKINKYANNKNFKPFEFSADFNLQRTSQQNKYYWGVVVKSQYEHFSNDLVSFLKWIMDISSHGLLTPDLIHEFNKIFYNQGKSSAKLSTIDFVENFVSKIREDMLHYCGLDIPLPRDESLLQAFEEYLKRYEV